MCKLLSPYFHAENFWSVCGHICQHKSLPSEQLTCTILQSVYNINKEVTRLAQVNPLGVMSIHICTRVSTAHHNKHIYLVGKSVPL